MQAVREALGALRELGSVEELWALAEKKHAPAKTPRVNAHIHLPPNFSAFESVQQAVTLAREQEVGVLGVSNYYDYNVYADFVQQARKAGIFPLFGLEIIVLVDELIREGIKTNDPGNPGKIYICGKGITRFDELTPVAAEILNKIRYSDSTRMGQMVEKLRTLCEQRGFDSGVTPEGVIEMIVARHGSQRETVYIQERHICQAFQEALFQNVPAAERPAVLEKVLGTACKAKPEDHVGIQNDLRSQLMKAGKAAYVEETFIDLEKAYTLILELGGIPCYPTLADGAKPITPFEATPEILIKNIQSRGFHCAEFIPLRNDPAVLREYVTKLRAAGLAITGGTEHNSLDLIPFEPACVGGASVPEEVKAIFWEGACVIAAHQFLTLHGQTGFVDAQGQPNAKYASADERIRAFAALGAAVIQRYFEKNK
jgi:hypothetical protein